MLFHTIFVGGPLAKQWRNQKPRVEFVTFCGKVFFLRVLKNLGLNLVFLGGVLKVWCC